MNQPSKGFHPITRAFAYVGAFICAFFSLTIFISSVFAFTDIFNLLAGFGMTVLTSMLAWAFWYAGKAGKCSGRLNPNTILSGSITLNNEVFNEKTKTLIQSGI